MKVPDFLKGVLSLACFSTQMEAQQLSPAELYRAKIHSAELMQRGQSDSALVLLRRITILDSADASLWRRRRYFLTAGSSSQFQIACT